MMTFVFAARTLGRKVSGAGALGASICMGALTDPLIGEDGSFLLSVLATVGLLTVSPLSQLWEGAPGWLGGLLTALLATLGASLACGPAIASMNEQMTLAALGANLVVGPVGELAALPAALLHAASPLGSDFEWGSAQLASGALWLVRHVALWSASVEALRFSVPSPDAWCVAVAMAAAIWPAPQSLTGRAAVAGAFAAVVIATRLAAPMGVLRVTALDVGQGDALFLEFPSGGTALVDGGGVPHSPVDVGERTLLPFFRARGQTRLDLVVLTHPDADHLLGLRAVLEKLEVGELWHGAALEDPSRGLAELLEIARRRHVLVRPAPEICGDTTRFGVKLRVLAPCEELGLDRNNRSVVLRLAFGRRSALLTGDVELAGEQALTDTRAGDLRSDLLKVAHHGSDTSSSPEFLDAVRPAVAFISVGVRNGFGHPSQDVLERLRERGAWIGQTGESGALTWETDGERASVILTSPVPAD